MATVVITLLIITRFYVSKMDADSEERPRVRISRREKRWSMNSQRLEQIVAELMRPIGDLRRSFDTDLSALLEEYLTEAGLHALEAGERSPDSSGSPDRGPGAAPNFAELALLLQQSANIYGRKVDFLYQHVLEVSESLQNSTNELSQSGAPSAEAATPSGAGGATRRKRLRSGGAADWARIELVACAGARREATLRPPPTLPRMYVELEPRVLAPCDAPLLDYHGEPVGLLHDFHVTWRLHGGLLVDELECGSAAASGALRAIPLAELQAAIEAAAPPEPPPPPSPEPPDAPDASLLQDSRLVTSTPLPTEAEEPPPAPALEGAGAGEGEVEAAAGEEAAPAQRRKRKPDPDLYEHGAGKIYVTPELRVFLRQAREFTVSPEWVARVVEARSARLRAMRAAQDPPLTEFRGFDTAVDQSDISDIGGFPGFDSSACVESELALTLSRLSEVAGESDDDGFFEQSELGSEGSAPPPPSPPPPAPSPPPPPPPVAVDLASSPEWFSWRAEVVARAAAGEARGLAVRELGRAVLAALPGAPGPPTPFAAVLHTAAKDDADVSRLFLATLFLANAGNVEVVPGAALALDSFALRVVSRDERLYCAAADTDPAFLAR